MNDMNDIIQNHLIESLKENQNNYYQSSNVTHVEFAKKMLTETKRLLNAPHVYTGYT